MTTLEIILTSLLIINVGLHFVLVHALNQSTKVMKMASENSDTFYNAMVKAQNSNNTTTAVTNINVSDMELSDDVKTARAEALQMARQDEKISEAIKEAAPLIVNASREASIADTVEMLNRREL